MSQYKSRILYRIDLVCDTPLKVGYGEKGILTDDFVILDENGLPFIPGTTLAGVMKHQLPTGLGNMLFGTQENGSRLTVTDAKLVYENGRAADGLVNDFTPLLARYADLPVRQHVRIGHHGAHVKGGKFDEQVVFAGSRFRFEMQLVSDNVHDESLDALINLLTTGAFRIGGGTRKGFGKTHIVGIKKATLDLSLNKDLNAYLEKSSSLDEDWSGWQTSDIPSPTSCPNNWKTICLTLTPEDFFLFSSGFGGENSDMAPVKEIRIGWNGDIPSVEEGLSLIPASSVKGALAHRVAFYYNKIKGIHAEDIPAPDDYAMSNNKAVRTLFGAAGNKRERSVRGNVIVSDLYSRLDEMNLHHVTVNDYTGGALEGHLFSEDVSWGNGHVFNLEIHVNQAALHDLDVKEAFYSAIHDICDGYLPLGGGVNRGHGVFSGTIEENDN